MNFIGREKFLNKLEALWHKRSSSLVTVRGRRRIGKSTLVAEFAARTADHFIAIDGQAPAAGVTKKTQLRSFVEQLVMQTSAKLKPVSNWLEAFRLLADALPRDGRVVVLLDEISWMSEGDKAFAGTLKIVWDKLLDRRDNLILILCGSVSSWIAENILHSTGFVGRDSLDLVIDELPLKECLEFWGDARHRTSIEDFFDYLSVTGGVPKYLRELDPSKSASENIRSLCFTKDGVLFREFDQIFHSIFGKRSEDRRAVLLALSEGSHSISDLSVKLGRMRNGHLGETLEELELAGFVAKDWNVNPQTGHVCRTARYRIKDNYTRFYLRYIDPVSRQIESGIYQYPALESLSNWDVIRGLQFENLVVSNYRALLPMLGIDGASLLSVAPFRRNHGKNGTKGVQIDLLIQTHTSVYVVEVKRRNTIDESVVDEINQKVRLLQIPSKRSVRTALVYLGNLSPRIRTDHMIDFVIPAERLLSVTGDR